VKADHTTFVYRVESGDISYIAYVTTFNVMSTKPTPLNHICNKQYTSKSDFPGVESLRKRLDVGG